MKRLDTPTRAFVELSVAATLLGAAAGLVACCVVAFVTGRALSHGFAATLTDARLRPAVLLAALIGSGTAAGAVSVLAQARRTRQLDTWAHRHAVVVPREVDDAARRVGVRRIRVLEVSEPTAFTVGLVAPVVVISRGLVDELRDDELDAVLEHERYHVRHRDPLKMVVARVLTRVHFYVPALATLRDRYLVGRELAADRRSVRRHGEAPLARALLKVAAEPAVAARGAAATLGGVETFEARVAQLETGHEPPPARQPVALIALSIVGGAAFTWALVFSAVTFGGLPGAMGRLCGCS